MRGPQAAEDSSSLAAQWRAQHPEGRWTFDNNSFPQTRLEKPWFLPKQDNYCDCGLFLLAYMHFFTHSLPEEISKSTLATIPGVLFLF